MKKLIKKFADPDGGLFVEFPSYMVDTERKAPQVVQSAGEALKVLGKTKKGNTTAPLGHGAVVVFDDKGRARGSEYGRYSGKKAHKINAPDLVAKDPNNPTEEELQAYAQEFSRRYGNQGKTKGHVKITYVPGTNYNEAVKLMQSAESGKGYYTDKPYNLMTHNCGTYAHDLLRKATPWYKSLSPIYGYRFEPFSWGTAGSNRPSGMTVEYNPNEGVGDKILHIISGEMQ